MRSPGEEYVRGGPRGRFRPLEEGKRTNGGDEE